MSTLKEVIAKCHVQIAELNARLNVMYAFEEGYAIEFKSKSMAGCDWIATACPAWNWHDYDYRIALKQGANNVNA